MRMLCLPPTIVVCAEPGLDPGEAHRRRSRLMRFAALGTSYVCWLFSLHAGTVRADNTPLPACHSQASRLPSGTAAFRDCEGAPQMIPLRGGSYRMGDLVGDGQPYERPAHEVKLAPFGLWPLRGHVRGHGRPAWTPAPARRRTCRPTSSMAATRWPA